MRAGTLIVFLVSLFVVSSCSIKNYTQSNELKPVIQKVTWPNSSLINKDVLSTLNEEDQKKISKSSVPVLFLKLTQPMSESVFIVEPNFYAASFRLNSETHFSIIGTNVGYRINESIAPSFNCKVHGTNGIVDENVGIWSVTWSEYGVSYAIDIERSNQNNPYCSKDYIVHLANDLIYLGGSGK